jgi:hypothetical protein
VATGSRSAVHNAFAGISKRGNRVLEEVAGSIIYTAVL